MLNDFAEIKFGHPANESELIEEVKKMPIKWIIEQKPFIDNKLKEYDKEFELDDAFCCWILIILRLKYCFEMLDECNPYYRKYFDSCSIENSDVDALYEIDDKINQFKEEAFYLFNKWFFNLWW